MKGKAAVEMAIILPALFLIILGGLETARYITIKHSLSAGTWEAARYLSLNPWDEAEAFSIIKSSLEKNILGAPSELKVEIYFEDPLKRGFGSRVSVRAEVPFSPIFPPISFLPPSISSSHSLLVEAWP